MTTPAHPPAGAYRWYFSAGMIPEHSTGHEPEFTSRIEICLLNTGVEEARVQATVYHENSEPVGPYEIRVPGARVCHVRINDLIEPEAVPLGRPFGLALDSEVPVVAQLMYLDTRSGQLAVTSIPGIAEGSGGSER